MTTVSGPFALSSGGMNGMACGRARPDRSVDTHPRSGEQPAARRAETFRKRWGIASAMVLFALLLQGDRGAGVRHGFCWMLQVPIELFEGADLGSITP